MTEKNEAELKIARRVLGIWEEKYFELPQGLRQAFLNKPHLTRLVNVSDDNLRQAIGKYQELDDMIPYALAVQVETFRRELTGHINTNHESELANATEEIQKLKRELSRLRDTEDVNPGREQHFERLAHQQQRKIDSLETNLSQRKSELAVLHEQSKSKLDALREQRDQYKKERDDLKKERDHLEARLKRQSFKSAIEQHSKNSTTDEHPPKEKAQNGEPSATKSSRKKQDSKAPPRPQGGVAHKASGFSGKPRQMQPEFNDTERCSNCGARISASSAASHDCW